MPEALDALVIINVLDSRKIDRSDSFQFTGGAEAAGVRDVKVPVFPVSSEWRPDSGDGAIPEEQATLNHEWIKWTYDEASTPDDFDLLF